MPAKKIRKLFPTMEYKGERWLLIHITMKSMPDLFDFLLLMVLMFLPGLTLVVLTYIFFTPFKFVLNSAIDIVEDEDTIVEVERPTVEKAKVID